MLGIGHTPSSAQVWADGNAKLGVYPPKSHRMQVFVIQMVARDGDATSNVSLSRREKRLLNLVSVKEQAFGEHAGLKDVMIIQECLNLDDTKRIPEHVELTDVKFPQERVNLKDVNFPSKHANSKEIEAIQKHARVKVIETMCKHESFDDLDQENSRQQVKFIGSELDKRTEDHRNSNVLEQEETTIWEHDNVEDLFQENSMTERVKDLCQENGVWKHVNVSDSKAEMTIQKHVKWKHWDQKASIIKHINLDNMETDGSTQKQVNLSSSDLVCPIFSVDGFLFSLKDCRERKDLSAAKKIHQEICGLGLDKVLEDELVATFVDCGSISGAQLVFNKLVHRDEYAWTRLIQGYITARKLHHAFKLLQNMHEDCIIPSRYTYLALIKACIDMRCLSRARELHLDIIKEGHENDPFVRSTLVDLYMKIGSPIEARGVFEEIQSKDVFLWTALIAGYCERGLDEEALSCFLQMQRDGVVLDRVTYVWGLKSCTNLASIDIGRDIHYKIVRDGMECDTFVGSTLINMYASCGLLTEARELLSELPTCNVVSWNALIAGYLEHNHGKEALNCLKCMRTANISPNEVTFVSCLKACASIGALHVGQEIHAQIIKQGFEKDAFLGSILMDMYIKCGSFQEMCQVFDELTTRDVVSWTTSIAGYVEHGFYEEALKSLDKMQVDGTSADAVTFVCILNGCGNAKAIRCGFQVHVLATKRGLDKNISVSNALIKMYAEINLFPEAQDVFNKLLVKDVSSWNALIGGLAEYDRFEEALKCIDQMQRNGPCMNIPTFIHGLRMCSSMKDADRGFELHSEILKNGFERDTFLRNLLVDVYSKCGRLLEAQHVIDRLADQNSISWSSLISGYVEHGQSEQVLDCLEHMQRNTDCQDVVTFICGLKACSSMGFVRNGLELYIEIVKEGLESDTFVGSSVVDMFGKWGALVEAQEVLDDLPVRNVVSWTALIAAYAEFACFEDVMRCCKQMQLEGVCPNSITYVSILKACSGQQVIDTGQKIHNEILILGFQSDPLLCATLVDMYVACGFLMEAKKVFTIDASRGCLSWNALIGGYAEQGNDHQVLACLKDMQLQDMNPDNITYFHCVKACTNLGAVDLGQELYVEIVKKGIESDFLVGSSLLNMYAKHGAFVEAKMVSNHLPLRDAASWNPLIGGYVEQGFCQEAWSCFEEMQLEGVIPDVVSWNLMLLCCAEQGETERVVLMYAQMQEQGMLADSTTFVSIIQACGNMASLRLGEKIYALCCRHGNLHASEVILATAIIDMYGKCGRMNSALQLFEAMPIKDPSMWNAMIVGYSRQGKFEYALHTFERMKETTRPDAVTFLCVLTACNHGGLIDRAQLYFESMNEYGVCLSFKHYNCMLDLLARAGRLEDALKLLKQMPFEPNESAVNTVLGACQKWKDLEAAQEVFDYALRLDQRHAGTFVLMSNIYADFDMREESLKLKEIRKQLAYTRTWGT